VCGGLDSAKGRLGANNDTHVFFQETSMLSYDNVHKIRKNTNDCIFLGKFCSELYFIQKLIAVDFNEREFLAA